MTEKENKVENNEEQGLTLVSIPKVLSKFGELDEYELITFDAKNNEYTFIQFDELNAKLDYWIDEASKIQYTPDDRKEMKNISTMSNKLSSLITKTINDTKKGLFNNVDDQKKELSTKFATLARELKKGIDEADKITKEEKRKEMMKAFDSAILTFENLPSEELAYEDFEMSHWNNLTSSLPSSIKEMHNLLKETDKVFGSKVNPSNDTDVIMDALRKNDWNGLDAITQIIEEENAKLELIKQKELELEQLKAEQLKAEQSKLDNIEENNQQLKKIPKMLIEFDSEDSDDLLKILDKYGFEYKIVQNDLASL